MDEHLAAIRQELERMVRERDTVPRPLEKDFPDIERFDMALVEWHSNKGARREVALGEQLRGAFRALEDLTNFLRDPPVYPPEPALEIALPEGAAPVVYPEGVRGGSRRSRSAASVADDADQDELAPPAILQKETT